MRFFNSKEEKITEKAFSQTLILSAIAFILCIAVLSSMTYAWFTDEISSGKNMLVSGSFDVSVSVTSEADEEIAVATAPGAGGVYSCTLPEAGRYTVVLKLTEDSTVKGHCIIKLGTDSAKHTYTIIGAQTKNCEGREISDPFTFTIEVDEPTTLIIEARWGEVVEPDIFKNQVYSQRDQDR
jgi:hypothetical protein